MQELLRRVQAALAGRYSIEHELGRGGMAVVYLARDERHGRPVALKVLRPELAASLATDRFLREIAIAARLTHPHILPLHDSGEVPATSEADFTVLYYVMPYVEGESLRDRLSREGPLPIRDALRLARGAATALAHAHGHGIIHRDIKPENILLEDGEAVVADFGLARALDAASDEPLSVPGLAMGTPAYMSPEQGCGDDVDARTDIYAWGCVFYEMLAGEPPFTGATPQMVQARHRSEPPRSVALLRPNLPAGVQALLESALAKLPADRPATAAALVRTLDDLIDGQTTPPPAAPAPSPAARPRRFPVGALAAIAALGLVALFVATSRGAFAGDPAPLLVADFEGPATDPELTHAFRELVIAGLGASSRLAPVPPHQVRGAMRDAGMADTLAVTLERARELAYRLSVRAVVSGSIEQPSPGSYALVVSTVDAESGRLLTSSTESAQDSTFVAAVERLTARARERLGERQSEIAANKPLWQVATPSFAAFRKYVQALELARGANLAGSNRLLHEAIALDTAFAAAWGALGMNFITERNLDSARLAFGEALRRPGRLSDAQRYRMNAEAAYALHRDLPEAVRWYGLYLQEVPRSVGGRNNRGLFLSAMGRYEEALDDFDDAIALERGGDALAQPQLVNAALMAWALGRPAEARRYRERLQGPYADYATLIDAAIRADWAVAETAATRIQGDATTPSWVRMQAVGTLASALVARGATDQARALLERSASVGGAAGRWYLRALLLLADASGQPRPLPDLLAADTSVAGSLLRAEWLAAQSDSVAADSTLDAVLSRHDLEEAWLGFSEPVVRARLLAVGGDWGGAARLLSPIATAGEPDNTSPDRVGTLHLRWLAAVAWERAGQPDSARVHFRRLAETTRLTANQLALRGLVLPHAARHLVSP
ncbi:MAG: protein kinase domain-containing protein [Gemmatimonadota bacterium]